MARKKKEIIEEVVEVEVIKPKEEKNKKMFNLSEGFYYLIGIIFGIALIFATEKFLSTINYLFVIIFVIISIIKLINFYVKKDYQTHKFQDLTVGIMSAWIAVFIFKHGEFLFLEMLPVLVSLLLFVMGISSITKYFTKQNKGNLVLGLVSILFGILLMVLPENIMYICFKVVGIYLLIIIILDLIDHKINAYK